ncbi:hypothetical protein [Pseudoduganella rhizocola]
MVLIPIVLLCVAVLLAVAAWRRRKRREAAEELAEAADIAGLFDMIDRD